MARVILTRPVFRLSDLKMKQLLEETIGATGKILLGGAAIGTQAVGGTILGAGKAFSKAFIGTDPKKYADMPFKMGLNKAGITTMLAVGAAAGIRDGYDSYTNSRMGTPTGVENGTPVIPEYESPEMSRRNMRHFRAENYGAGGDLVFALNRNRH